MKVPLVILIQLCITLEKLKQQNTSLVKKKKNPVNCQTLENDTRSGT